MPDRMTPSKATEIITLFKNKASLYSTLDLKEALTIALVCMSYCDALIKALGEEEIAKLIKGD